MFVIFKRIYDRIPFPVAFISTINYVLGWALIFLFAKIYHENPNISRTFLFLLIANLVLNFTTVKSCSLFPDKIIEERIGLVIERYRRFFRKMYIVGEVSTLVFLMLFFWFGAFFFMKIIYTNKKSYASQFFMENDYMSVVLITFVNTTWCMPTVIAVNKIFF